MSDSKLTLKQSQKEFVDFITRLKPKDVAPFLRWVEDSFSMEREQEKPKYVRDAAETIMEIAEHIKQRIPSGGTMDSEKITFPVVGYDADCNDKNTVHVDCFLYDDNAVEELVEQGKLTRNYCGECGSKNTKALTFISHSLAPAQLEFMFTELVPLKDQKKENFRVVDIGSRLGAVIYAASKYSVGNAVVTGIEMNEELCKLQNDVIKEFDLENVSVVCSDVRNQNDVMSKADLVVMNNVFSFFLPPDEQASCWRFLHSTLPPGCLIIHNPDMADVISHLDLPFTVEQWLEKIPTDKQCAKFAKDDEDLYEDCSHLAFYRVRAKQE